MVLRRFSSKHHRGLTVRGDHDDVHTMFTTSGRGRVQQEGMGGARPHGSLGPVDRVDSDARAWRGSGPAAQREGLARVTGARANRFGTSPPIPRPYQPQTGCLPVLSMLEAVLGPSGAIELLDRLRGPIELVDRSPWPRRTMR